MKRAKAMRPNDAQAASRPAAPPAAPGVPWAWSAAVALAAFVVYLLQSPPVSGDKDSAEFTLVLALNGVAHPTGYPVFTLLGHAWVLLIHSIGATWAYAANSWSALGGAVAVFFLHRLALRLIAPARIPGRRANFILGWLPVALFALNPIWTYETTLAEVYSWHVAWVLGTALYFTWLVGVLANGSEWAIRRLHAHAAAWGLLCGLGGAHHATSVFVAAPLSLALLVVLAARRRLNPALVPTVLLGTLVPLASYAFIYWRALHPAAYQWSNLAPGLDGLRFHMTGAQYWQNLGRFDPSPEQVRFLKSYVLPILFPGLVLQILNALRARDLGGRTIAWTLAFSAAAGTAYAFNYAVIDPSSYFLYPMALGSAALPALIAGLWAVGTGARRAAVAMATIASGVALALWAPWLKTGFQRVELYVRFDRYVHSMWDAIPDARAFVFWTDDMYTKLLEYQLLDHQKPGVEVLHAYNICNAAPRARFIARHGFDPGQRLDRLILATPGGKDSVSGSQAISAVEGDVNDSSPLPVIHFDPAKQTVRLLRKAK